MHQNHATVRKDIQKFPQKKEAALPIERVPADNRGNVSHDKPFGLEDLPSPYNNWAKEYLRFLKHHYNIEEEDVLLFAQCINDLLRVRIDRIRTPRILFGAACFAFLKQGNLFENRKLWTMTELADASKFREWNKHFGREVAEFLYYHCTDLPKRLLLVLIWRRRKTLQLYEYLSRELAADMA